MRHRRRIGATGRGLLAAALVTAGLLGATPASAVVGGAQLAEGQLPAIAFIGDCTGSLVAPTWVLSAGHCVQSGLPVRIGSVRHDEGGEVRDVQRYVRHPGYPDPTPPGNFLPNDLLLIELTEPSTVTPLALASPDQASAWAGGATVTVSGFGISCGFIAWGDPSCDGVDVDAAHTADMPVLDGQACQAMAGYEELDRDTMICTLVPGGGVSACFGDSGGPLTAVIDSQQVLIGTVSGGLDPCGRPDGPDVFTQVAAFRDWILGVTAPAPPTPTTSSTSTPTSRPSAGGSGVTTPTFTG